MCVYTVTILSQKWLLNKLGSQNYGLDETHFNFNVSAYNNHLGIQVVFYQTEVVTVGSVSNKRTSSAAKYLSLPYLDLK